jgi:hypothetical protein
MKSLPSPLNFTERLVQATSSTKQLSMRPFKNLIRTEMARLLLKNLTHGSKQQLKREVFSPNDLKRKHET